MFTIYANDNKTDKRVEIKPKQKSENLINTKDNEKKHFHEFEWQGKTKYKNKNL